ncbi:MAG TPA: EAL domain-containing protein [Xanthobacteraceae bacterium]|nr:EAL domain-containing protein [Xanthobacteraceae bacterium]
MIAVIWMGATFLAHEKHDSAYENALRQGNNLTRIFAEYISRIIRGTDSQLLMLRELYQKNPQGVDLLQWINDAKFKNDIAAQFAIAGPDGFVRFSTVKAITTPVDIGDREHFLVHMNSNADELFISRPIVGRVSGITSINLTRRLTAPDGSFGGIVIASLDIQRIEQFYNSINIGSEGIISLLGFDGVVRAHSGGSPTMGGLRGRAIPNAKVFQLYREAPTGAYWNMIIPGIHRLISYRVIDELPLIAAVGLAENDIFAKPRAEAYQYYQFSLALTAFVLVVIGIAALRRMKLLAASAALESSKLSLEQANIWFHTAIENMAHGLCMFDRDGRLLISNSRYREMYGLTAEQAKPGTSIRSILQARAAAGNIPKEQQHYVENRIAEIEKSQPYNTLIEVSGGRVYAINHQPMRGGGWVGIHQDVTDRQRAEQELDQTKRFLHTIIEHVPVSIVVKEPVSQKFILVNKAYEEFIGMPREKLIGSTVYDFYQEEHASVIAKCDAEVLQTKQQLLTAEFAVDIPSKGQRFLTTTRLVVCDAAGQPQYLIAVIEDSTNRKKSETQISFMAHHDLLTGLVNRALFLKKIEEAGERLRQHGETFSIFMLDLDRFKDVNDSLGHHMGDELLKEAAHRLRSSLRDSDTLARLGGDEFAIIQTGDGDQRENAIALAIRLIDSLNEPFDIEGHKLSIGTSIGISLAPEDGTNSDELMKKSDMALYRAKADGRNSYSFFDPAMTAQADARHHLERDLRKAISNEEFELHYQPVIDVKTQKICAVEALVRWRHPKQGLVSPLDFIPLSEETGLIVPLGEWVLQQACKDAVNWPSHIKVAVNLSPVQFRKGSLLDVILCLLVETGLPPHRLELEITESVLFENEGRNVTMMHQLKNLGISIALDDFGTGYSSLSYLTMFPFDKIKIDKSFTLNMTKNTASAAIIAAVLSLGRSLDIATTAEGVETWQEFQSLRVSGVNFVQGNLFAQPKPVTELDFDRVYDRDFTIEIKKVANVA